MKESIELDLQCQKPSIPDSILRLVRLYGTTAEAYLALPTWATTISQMHADRLNVSMPNLPQHALNPGIQELSDS